MNFEVLKNSWKLHFKLQSFNVKLDERTYIYFFTRKKDNVSLLRTGRHQESHFFSQRHRAVISNDLHRARQVTSIYFSVIPEVLPYLFIGGCGILNTEATLTRVTATVQESLVRNLFVWACLFLTHCMASE